MPRRMARRWRRARRAMLGVALVIALVSLGYALATRGPIPRMAVSRFVMAATGCEYEAESTWVSRHGTLEVRGLRLRVPGVEGPGGEVLSAESLRVALDWSGALRGDVRALGVKIVKPVVRLSQAADGTLNVMRAKPASGGSSGAGIGGRRMSAGGKPVGLPIVRAEEGVIELGEHDATRFRALARLPVEGGLLPVAGTVDRYTIQMKELRPPSASPEAGVRIEGEYDAGKGEAHARLEGLALGQWTPDTVPLALRKAWRELALEGRVAGAEVRYSEDRGFEGRVDLQGIAMSLPVPTERDDAKAPRVRVTEVNGWMSVVQGGGGVGGEGFGVNGGAMEASVRGLIEDLPCQINLRTTGLNPDTATIDCEVISEGFEMRKTWALRPFAPRLVVERLEQFSGPTALVDARTKVRRVNGKWSYTGSVVFEKGRAAFEHFPYPFIDMAGRVEFDDERVRIVGITGRGLTGARMVATGEIWPPEDGENVRIHVDVRDAPIDAVIAAAIDRRTVLAREVLWKPTDEALQAAAEGRDGGSVAGETVFDRLLGPERYRDLLGGERTWRMGLYGALFCEAEHARLRGEGLVLEPGERAALLARADAIKEGLDRLGPGAREAAEAEVAALERRAARPEFGFAGMIDELGVDVRRAPDTKGHYDTDITLKFREAGLVPEPFPLPVIATNLVVKVRDEALVFEGRGFRGLGGGEADIEGSLDITDPERTAKVPRMTVTARVVPVDDLLLAAIPDTVGAGSERAGGDDEASAPAILRRLNLTGGVDCTAKVWQREDGEPGFDVLVTMADVEARPRDHGRADGENRVALSKVGGAVRVTHERLLVEGLSGTVGPADCEEGDEAGRAVPFTLSAERVFPTRGAAEGGGVGREGSLRARVTADGLDLAWPIEDAVAAVSADAAEELAALRRSHDPRGRVHAVVTLGPSAVPGAGADRLLVTADVSRTAGLSFRVLGGRVGVDQSAGSIGVRLDRGAEAESSTSIAFKGAKGAVSFDGVASGEITATGVVGLSPGGGERGSSGGDEARIRPIDPLWLEVRGGAMESGLTRRVLGGAVGEGVQRWLETHEVGGAFDAELELSPAEDGARWTARGWVQPRSLALTRSGVRAEAGVAGRVEVEGTRMRLLGIGLDGGEWSASVDGALRAGADGPWGEGSWELTADVSGRSDGLARTLEAVLPEGVFEGARAISLEARGPATLTDGRLMLAGRSGGSSASWIDAASFTGQVAFEQAAMDVGAAVTEASGVVLVEARLAAGAPRAEVRLDVTMPSCRAMGVGLTDAACVVTTGRREGEILVPVIAARGAGGTLTGTAFVRPAERGPAREYAARLEAAGVRVADLIAERVAAGVSVLPTSEVGGAARERGGGGGARPGRGGGGGGGVGGGGGGGGGGGARGPGRSAA